MRINDFKGKHVHFIGIGGISMSGLAEILIGRGYKVSGSDALPSLLTRKLESMGAEIFIGQKYGQHKGAALIVKTSAISPENEELRGALEDGVPVFERIDVLSQLMDESCYSVGISGMHGKSTCTSMTATVLIGCGMDPTIHIGSELTLIGGTTYVGKGNIFVAEACEYKDNFLSLNPNVEVILNIDRDHLDYFRDLNHIINSFSKYIAKIPEDGVLIANGDDKNVLEAAASRRCEMLTFGFGKTNNVYAENLSVKSDGSYDFDLIYKGEDALRVSLGVPGKQHIYNAMAAIAASVVCGADIGCAVKEISKYHGAKRRFEYIGKSINGAEIYHDYAHHPAEVAVNLESAKSRGYKNVICIFQPHTYTRTKALLNEFAASFDPADHVIFVDIYAAREKDPGDIHSKDLCGLVHKRGKVPSVCYQPSFEDAAAYAKAVAKEGDIILTMGAGSIEKINDMLV